MSAEGKTVVITGASMGIGEALAKEFSEHGATVVMSSRDVQRVEAARARIGNLHRTVAVACDVTRKTDIENLVRVTQERFGRIDVWINNAGYGLLDNIATLDMAACRRMFDTNLFGAIDCLQAVVPLMRKQGSGAVINIASVAGHIAVPGMGAYSGTKFALIAMGRAARLELRGSGVNVLTVCPGYIETNFAQNAVKGGEARRLSAAAKRRIGPERVARAVYRAWQAGKREIVVPWRDWIIIKMYEHWPTLLEWGMARMLKPAEEVIAQADAARKR
jgi:short-subunit dehydrogenase